jgi:hypothetical protein
MAGKDVEDQSRAVDDFDIFAQHLFQFALLAGRKFVVKQHGVDAHFDHANPKLFQLAAADQRGRVGGIKPLGHGAHDLQPGSLGQQRQFG